MISNESTELSLLEKKIDTLLTEFKLASISRKKHRALLKRTKRNLRHTANALIICQDVAATIQQRAHDKIAKIVSRCLEAIFDEPYEFKILFERKRGRTEANLVFIKNGRQFDPVASSGGGVVDIAAFALRLSCLLLSRPPLHRVLFLDEPFRFVSEEYQGRVAQLIGKLSRELDVQIIMTTHNRAYRQGKIIRL